MKLFRRIVAVTLLLIIASCVSSYLYFKDKFKAPQNQLEIEQSGFKIPFRWVIDSLNNELNPYAGLILPVQLVGCDRTFYMQFDLGSPISIFYKNKLDAIALKYNNIILQKDEKRHKLVDYTFNVGKMPVTARMISVRQYEDSGIDWTDSTRIEIIGTIGSDLIEGRTLILNYPQQLVELHAQTPENLKYLSGMAPFSWKERKVLLPAIIDGDETSIYFDTGSSAFELLTDKSTWSSLSRPDTKAAQYGVKSWNKTLTAFTVDTDYSIQFNSTQIPLRRVTYIEGTSFLQNLMMMASGMGGMTGNKLFVDKVLIIDTKNQLFGIVEASADPTPRQF